LRDLNDITVDLLRSRGITQAFVARESRLPYQRLQHALAGAGVGWLEPEEQHRLLNTLARLGLLEAARDPMAPAGL
jgi:hypothetical protein